MDLWKQRHRKRLVMEWVKLWEWSADVTIIQLQTDIQAVTNCTVTAVSWYTAITIQPTHTTHTQRVQRVTVIHGDDRSVIDRMHIEAMIQDAACNTDASLSNPQWWVQRGHQSHLQSFSAFVERRLETQITRHYKSFCLTNLFTQYWLHYEHFQ